MIGPLLKREIESMFTVVADKSSAEELVFLCPECGDHSGHRSVNLRTGFTFCFRCNKGAHNKGNFMAWSKALGYQFLNSDNGYSNVPLEELLNNPPAVRTKMPVLKPVDLPVGFTRLEDDPDSAYTELIRRMAKRKNLDLKAFIEAGAGFTEQGLWEPYCIFPVYDSKMPVYYQGRTYVDVPGEPTKRFPNRKDVTYGASYWVYNIDEVRTVKPNVIIMVESILNVLSLKRKLRALHLEHKYVPVCVFKHFVSQVQVQKLLLCGAEEFCLLFDHDAIALTWKSVAAFSNLTRVTIAEMPQLEGNKKADANDDVDAAWDAIRNRKRYSAAAVTGNLVTVDPLRAMKQACDITKLRIGSIPV